MEVEERNKWKCEYEKGEVEDKRIGANRMTEHKGKSHEEEDGKEESREEVRRSIN